METNRIALFVRLEFSHWAPRAVQSVCLFGVVRRHLRGDPAEDRIHPVIGTSAFTQRIARQPLMRVDH